MHNWERDIYCLSGLSLGVHRGYLPVSPTGAQRMYLTGLLSKVSFVSGMLWMEQICEFLWLALLRLMCVARNCCEIMASLLRANAKVV